MKMLLKIKCPTLLSKTCSSSAHPVTHSEGNSELKVSRALVEFNPRRSGKAFLRVLFLGHCHTRTKQHSGKLYFLPYSSHSLPIS